MDSALSIFIWPTADTLPDSLAIFVSPDKLPSVLVSAELLSELLQIGNSNLFQIKLPLNGRPPYYLELVAQHGPVAGFPERRNQAGAPPHR